MMTDFAATKAMFHLPPGMIYLDGNSLGPLPKHALDRMAAVMQDEWGDMLITGWNRAGWMDAPARTGDRIARLIGAEPGSVVMGDTLSIKVYQALAAALDMTLAENPNRRIVLSDSGNFPSDLYMAQGLLASLGRAGDLRVIAPEAVADALTDDVAVLMLTEVDYRTGRRHDMAALTAAAQAKGIVTIWDLAHSAGAVDVDLTAANADFAVGCTYKYLNGGPGAPAFIYVAPRHQDRTRPALSGWLGHEAPFAFDLDYRAAPGIDRMRVGTPPILALAALDAALDVWDMTTMADVRAASLALADRFIAGVEAQCDMLTLATPRDPALRGSQVSFRFDHGYAAMQVLIEHGVIGDFRAPDIMRFGFTPLFIDDTDVDEAVRIVAEVMRGALWDAPRFQKRSKVT
jgi:kynureninase